MHLRYPGVEIEYDEEGNAVGAGGGAGSDGGEGGLRRVGHWKAERTHEMGKGKDWVSVWRR